MVPIYPGPDRSYLNFTIILGVLAHILNISEYTKKCRYPLQIRDWFLLRFPLAAVHFRSRWAIAMVPRKSRVDTTPLPQCFKRTYM
jgi:hypothetical protein